MLRHLSVLFFKFFIIISRLLKWTFPSLKSSKFNNILNGQWMYKLMVCAQIWPGLFHWSFVHVSIFAHVSPENVCYVLSTDGMSCIVTIVEPLLVLKCSPLLRSTFPSSTRGMWNPLSEDALDCAKLPETEFAPTLLMAMFVFVVVEDTFFRGLLEPAIILFACVLLLYVLRTISKNVRMMIIPMTIIAIMAPELCVRICSLDLVVAVVFCVVVYWVTDAVAALCIFRFVLYDQFPVVGLLSPQNQSLHSPSFNRLKWA